MLLRVALNLVQVIAALVDNELNTNYFNFQSFIFNPITLNVVSVPFMHGLLQYHVYIWGFVCLSVCLFICNFTSSQPLTTFQNSTYSIKELEKCSCWVCKGLALLVSIAHWWLHLSWGKVTNSAAGLTLDSWLEYKLRYGLCACTFHHAD